MCIMHASDACISTAGLFESSIEHPVFSRIIKSSAYGTTLPVRDVLPVFIAAYNYTKAFFMKCLERTILCDTSCFMEHDAVKQLI